VAYVEDKKKESDSVARGGIIAGMTAIAAFTSLAALSPATGASKAEARKPRVVLVARESIGSFTPAATDPRLAAVLSRSGLNSAGFRFTPASSVRINRSVTVAVRARTNRPGGSGTQTALVAAPVSSLAPIAYNLGVAVGWRKFAISGDLEKVDIVGVGGREAADVGLSYSLKRFSTRLQLGADRATGPLPRLIGGGTAYTADLGTSYSLTRNLDVTAGVRYRAERDRLLPQADTRRDSQAVYVGTAFRF
jgi:hypothetical protein